jgi:hypothetical protein
MKSGGKLKKREIEGRRRKLKKDQKQAKKSINSEKMKSINPKHKVDCSARLKAPMQDSITKSLNQK